MSLTVGNFPYRPVANPYQRLFTESLEFAGMDVVRIPPRKWFPVQTAFGTPCDILHFDWPHDWYAGKSVLVRLLKSLMYQHGLNKRTKSKLVWTVHNLVAHEATDEVYERRMIQKLIERCDGLMVMSQAALDSVRATYRLPEGLSTRIIPHGNFVGCYPNNVQRSTARSILGVDQTEMLVTSVGAVKPYKGIGSLVKTLIQEPKGNLRWIIAGAASGESLRVELKSLIAKANSLGNKIEFHDGRVDDTQLQVYFNAADAVVLPYDNILNSGSLLLALSFGCPVIAAAKGSIPEIAHPEFSFLFAPDDCDSFGAALRSAQDVLNSRDSDKVRSEILQFTMDRYGWSKIGAQLRTWYLELLSK